MATATLTRPATRRPPLGPHRGPAGDWAIDPERAVVAFHGRTSMLAPTIKARFDDVTGSVRADSVEVRIDVTSMTTGNRAWDEVITAFDPFEAAEFRYATYRSTAVSWTTDGAHIEGTLTLRGVARPVSLTATCAPGRNADRMRTKGGGTIDREAFGVRFDVPGIGRLVPRTLRLDVDVEVVRTEC